MTSALLAQYPQKAHIVRKIQQRTERETKLPTSHFEDLQVQHYSPPAAGGGHYLAHYDSMGEREGSAKGAGQRIATVIYYLQDVPDGGHTIFPMVNSDPNRTVTPLC